MMHLSSEFPRVGLVLWGCCAVVFSIQGFEVFGTFYKFWGFWNYVKFWGGFGWILIFR